MCSAEHDETRRELAEVRSEADEVHAGRGPLQRSRYMLALAQGNPSFEATLEDRAKLSCELAPPFRVVAAQRSEERRTEGRRDRPIRAEARTSAEDEERSRHRS